MFGAEMKRFNVNFTSNNQSFTGIEFNLGAAPYMQYVGSSTVTVYEEVGGWLDTGYKTIILTSSPEPELSTWLSNNSTQL